MEALVATLSDGDGVAEEINIKFASLRNIKC